MPTIKVNAPDCRKLRSTRLSRRARRVYSQYGEDGIIGAIFAAIGTASKWCVEFGAWDGVHLSNTCHLIRDHAWSAVQVEGNEARFAQLKENFSGNPNVVQRHTMIGYEAGVDTLDDALALTPIPVDFDLLSIDVDGNDWHIWESVRTYRPRVVVIEFNPIIANEVEFVQDRDMAVNEGSSLAAMIALGKSKGYELCATSRCNAFFVLEALFAGLGIEDNSIAAMHQNPARFVFYGFNGKIYHTLGKGGWRLRGTDVERPDSLQYLSGLDYSFPGSVPKGEPAAAETAD